MVKALNSQRVELGRGEGSGCRVNDLDVSNEGPEETNGNRLHFTPRRGNEYPLCGAVFVVNLQQAIEGLAVIQGTSPQSLLSLEAVRMIQFSYCLSPPLILGGWGNPVDNRVPRGLKFCAQGSVGAT